MCREKSYLKKKKYFHLPQSINLAIAIELVLGTSSTKTNIYKTTKGLTVKNDSYCPVPLTIFINVFYIFCNMLDSV